MIASSRACIDRAWENRRNRLDAMNARRGPAIVAASNLAAVAGAVRSTPPQIAAAARTCSSASDALYEVAMLASEQS